MFFLSSLIYYFDYGSRLYAECWSKSIKIKNIFFCKCKLDFFYLINNNSLQKGIINYPSDDTTKLYLHSFIILILDLGCMLNADPNQ
jgi:hypothetical protein